MGPLLFKKVLWYFICASIEFVLSETKKKIHVALKRSRHQRISRSSWYNCHIGFNGRVFVRRRLGYLVCPWDRILYLQVLSHEFSYLQNTFVSSISDGQLKLDISELQCLSHDSDTSAYIRHMLSLRNRYHELIQYCCCELTLFGLSMKSSFCQNKKIVKLF